MKRIWIFLTLMILLPFSLFSDQNEIKLHCEVVSEEVEKILCKLEVSREPFERQVTFFWHSHRYPQDDREHTSILKPYYASVYDYRFLRGRAQGTWSVRASVEDNRTIEVAKVEFILKGSELIATSAEEQ